MTRSFKSLALIAVLGGLGALLPTSAEAQTAPVLHACFVPNSGVVYRIKGPGLRESCSGKSHVEFSWNEEGIQGQTGPMGAMGLSGSDGADGAQGTAGADGADGADGAQGPAGADGADGAQGPAGTDGADGGPGADGPAGTDGAAGADGGPGADGPAGTDGAAGAKGEVGPQGPAGPTLSGLLRGRAWFSTAVSCAPNSNCYLPVQCADSGTRRAIGGGLDWNPTNNVPASNWDLVGSFPSPTDQSKWVLHVVNRGGTRTLNLRGYVVCIRPT